MKNLNDFSVKTRKLMPLTQLSLIPLLGLIFSLGCGHPAPTSEQIQQQAAQATQQARQAAQQAADKTRIAAANAEDKLNAVAAGVREGMNGGQSAQIVDLNSATRNQLVTLPGISSARANRIIANRPYSAPSDLVSKSLLTQSQFNRISARITARTPLS